MEEAHLAFTKQSVEFDEIDEKSPIIKWMRKQVYTHIAKQWPKKGKVLELNSGTGIDAFYLADRGYEVFATDAADGMLTQLQRKKENVKVNGEVTVKRLPFEDFHTLQEDGFDAVFSNFGGLNCLADLTKITRHLPKVLKPGAKVTWVLISPYCAWEWLFALKGNFKLAFRRLKKKNVPAHLEGVVFPTHYFSPQQVKVDFGEQFKLVSLEGLATFTPPPYLDWIAKRYPFLTKKLNTLDEKVNKWPLVNTLGDHFIITFEYKP